VNKHIESRRSFLQQSALLGAGVWTMTAGRSRAASSPNEKLNIGCIGVGGRGSGDLQSVAHENIVALCDVDQRTLNGAGERFPMAKRYTDYRQLLEQDDLDAVVIATPDHHHAPATLRAIRRGLHVYCEKPLTHTVQEARLVAEAAAKHKVATQMGTQNHEHPGYLRTVEWIQSGVIGPVREVHIVTDRPGHFWQQGLTKPTETKSIPEHLNWDEWLGPAADRPYHDAYVPFRWRGWWDFGCGAIGDMAIHLMDPSFWALKLGGTVSVTSFGPPPLPDCGPTWMISRFDFGARGDLVPCTVYWYEGVAQPPLPIAKELPMNGSLFVGDEGRIAVEHDKMPKLLPEEKFASAKLPDPYLPESPGHHQQWINACKSGSATGSNFGYAGPFTEIVLLGNVAYRTGQKITYDPSTMKVTNLPEANALLSKEYRKGWEI
jgi:predicted dehydrogenase